MTRARTLALLAVALLVLVAGTVAYSRMGGSSGPALESARVVLTESGFEPQEVTIKVGGVVTFSTTLDKPFWPASDPHPIHTIYGAFDPHYPIAADAEWPFRFEEVGSWRYHDHIRSYYTGIINVVQ